MISYFKFWASGTTAEGNTLKTEGCIAHEEEKAEGFPPHAVFDRVYALLLKDFPTVKFVEGKTKIGRLKKKPKWM